MANNKNRDKMKQTEPKKEKTPDLEFTGKNEPVYHSVALVPVFENNKVLYKIVEIGFTLSKQCVSMTVLETTDGELPALQKYQIAARSYGGDITKLRNQVQLLKDEK